MYKGGAVYILSSVSKRVLYIGVTSNLKGRIWEHKDKKYPTSFSARYNCILLVYFKYYDSIEEAITEEKRIKAGNREQKEALINSINPLWKDLYNELEY
jgi:putative endonuclease